jgi:hypothetical protein
VHSLSQTPTTSKGVLWSGRGLTVLIVTLLAVRQCDKTGEGPRRGGGHSSCWLLGEPYRPNWRYALPQPGSIFSPSNFDTGRNFADWIPGRRDRYDGSNARFVVFLPRGYGDPCLGCFISARRARATDDSAT